MKGNFDIMLRILKSDPGVILSTANVTFLSCIISKQTFGVCQSLYFIHILKRISFIMHFCILLGPRHICLVFKTVCSQRKRNLGSIFSTNMRWEECVMNLWWPKLGCLEQVPGTWTLIQLLMYDCSSPSPAVVLKLALTMCEHYSLHSLTVVNLLCGPSSFLLCFCNHHFFYLFGSGVCSGAQADPLIC